MRRVMSVGVLVGVLAMVAPVWAGTSYIYLQGGQAEYGTTTPCAAFTWTGASGNGQPYVVPNCTITTADTVYFHFTVPNDFNATNSAGNITVQSHYLAADDSTVGRTACWNASISVFRYGGSGYRSDALQTPAGTFSLIGGSSGLYKVGVQTTTLSNFYDAMFLSDCAGTSCAGSVATLKMQRVACGGGNTDLTGAAGLVDLIISYRN